MRINKYDIIFICGIILWMVETAIFGFNDKPINNIEKMLDYVSVAFLFFGGVGTWIIAINKTIIINIKQCKEYHG